MFFARLVAFVALSFVALGQTASAQNSVALNPPDAYLFVPQKSVDGREKVVSTLSVTIGNGYTAQPFSDAQIEITMSREMADSLRPLGSWASLSGNKALICNPIPEPVGAAKTVTATCRIPKVDTAETVTLNITVMGQKPGTVQRITVNIPPVAGESKITNQTETLNFITLESADLELSTTLKGPLGEAAVSTVYPNSTKGANTVATEASGGARFTVTGTVTNHGPSAVTTFWIDVPEQLGIYDYDLSEISGNCLKTTTKAGEPIYSCEIAQTLAVGQSYDFDYSYSVSGPQEASETSYLSQTTTVRTLESRTAPKDSVSSNNSTRIPMLITAGMDLSVTKTLKAEAPHLRGAPFSYQISASYRGTPPAEGGQVVVRDLLPEGLPLPQITRGAGETADDICTISPATAPERGTWVICTLPTVTEHASTTVELETFTLAFETVGETLTSVSNSASAELVNGEEVYLANNTAHAAVLTVVEPKYALTIDKARTVVAGQDQGFARIGDRITYELTVENTGNLTFTDKLRVVDFFPAGIRYEDSRSSEWDCAINFALITEPEHEGTTPVECLYTLLEGESLAPKSKKTVVLEGLLVGVPEMEGVDAYRLQNVAAPSWPGEDDWVWGAFDDHMLQLSKVEKSADLSVTKTVVKGQDGFELFDPAVFASTQRGLPENYVIYAITLENKGPYAATEARFVDTIEQLGVVAFEGTSPKRGVISMWGDRDGCEILPRTDLYSAQISCEWESYEVGTTKKIFIRALHGARPDRQGARVENRASFLSAETPDEAYGDNFAGPTSVPYSARYDLEVRKTSDLEKTIGYLGQSFFWRIEVENKAYGDGTYRDRTASSVSTLTDSLPAGMRILETTSSSGITCAPVSNLEDGITTADSKIICTVPSISVGAVREVNIKAEASSTLLSEMTGTDTNEVIVRDNSVTLVADSDELVDKGEFTAAKNTSAASARFSFGRYDLQVEKTVDQGMVRSGDIVTFTMDVSNNGPSRAENVVLRDSLPNQTVLVNRDGEPVNVFGRRLPNAAAIAQTARFVIDRDAVLAAYPTCRFYSPRAQNQRAVEFNDTTFDDQTATPNDQMTLVCDLDHLESGARAQVVVSGQAIGEGVIPNYASVTADRKGAMDDIDYLNNSSNTSATAESLVDLQITKTTLEREDTGEETDLDGYLFRDAIKFSIEVYNVGRADSAVQNMDDEDQLAYEYASVQPYFTDAKNVLITDELPPGFDFVEIISAKITSDRPARAESSWSTLTDGAILSPCALRASRGEEPGAPLDELECRIQNLPNGSTVRLEITARANASLDDPACVDCVDANAARYINTAFVTSDSKQPRLQSKQDENPDQSEEPEKATSNFEIILSSLSGHYFWDMRDNKLTTSSDQWQREDAALDMPVGAVTLILERLGADGVWQEVTRTQTNETGAYSFGKLMPGTYRIVDPLGFTTTSAMGDAREVAGRPAIAGKVTVGEIRQGTAQGAVGADKVSGRTDFGTATDIGEKVAGETTPPRGIATITLGQNEHGINYDLRVVPVPRLALDKHTTRFVQHPNGLLEIDYELTLMMQSQDGLEPIENILLTDTIPAEFGAYGGGLLDQYTALGQDVAALAQSADLGAGVQYIVIAHRAEVGLSTKPNPYAAAGGSVASSVGTLNTDFTGRAGQTTLLRGAVLAPIDGSVKAKYTVLVSLGQPVARVLPEALENVADAKGRGAWTGFEASPPTTKPTQTGDTRLTPSLEAQSRAEVEPQLQEGVSLRKTRLDNSAFEAMLRASGETDPSSFGALVYKFAITNTGDLPLTDIRLTDPRLGLTDDLTGLYFEDPLTAQVTLLDMAALPRPLRVLFAGESVSLYGVMPLTEQADFAAVKTGAALRNEATVSGQGRQPQTAVSSVTAQAAYTFTKTARVLREGKTASTPYRAGDVVEYDFVIQNTGQVDLKVASLVDSILSQANAAYKLKTTGQTFDLATWSDEEKLLRVGEAASRLSGLITYTITQDDIDALVADPAHPLLQIAPEGRRDNRLRNTATLTVEIAPGETLPAKEAQATVPLDRATAVETRKLAVYDALKAYVEGEVIPFAIEIKNTGNTTMSSIDVTDALAGLPSGALSPFTQVAPGTVILLYGPSYPASAMPDCALGTSLCTSVPALDWALTQDQINTGAFTNKASVLYTPIGTPPITQEPEREVTLKANPAVSIVKSVVSPLGALEVVNGLSAPITYRFVIANEGNVTLNDLRFTDALLEKTNLPVLADGTLGAASATGMSLAPLARVTVEVTHQFNLFTQGQTDPVLITTMLNALDAGVIENTAKVRADYKGPHEADSNEVSVSLAQNPDLTLVKTGSVVVVANEPSSAVAAQVKWTITVTNSGNVTLKDIVLTDPSYSATWRQEIGTLLPRETRQIVLTQDTTLAQRDAGVLSNTVTASFTPPGTAATPILKEASATVTLPQRPGIEIDKSTDPSFSVDTPVSAGYALKYHFRIRNTGNVTLTDLTFADVPLGITQALSNAQLSALSLGNLASVNDVSIVLPTSLAPSASWTPLGTITVSLRQDQINAGELVNTAEIFAKPPVTPDTPQPATVTHKDTVTTPLYHAPLIALAKSGRVSATGAPQEGSTVPTAQVGDLVTWTLTLSNTGNISLTNFIVEDETFPLSDAQLAFDPPWVQNPLLFEEVAGQPHQLRVIKPLVPGASYSFTLQSQLTAADLAAGHVLNEANVSVSTTRGRDKTPARLTEEAESTVVLDLRPELTVQKVTLAANGTVCRTAQCLPSEINGVLKHRFEITVENTGTMPLQSIKVRDLVSGVRFEAGQSTGGASMSVDQQTYNLPASMTLWPGDAFILYAEYLVPTEAAEVTGAHLTYADAGVFTNTATASGTGIHPSTQQSGPEVTAEDSSLAHLEQNPKFKIVKTVHPDDAEGVQNASLTTAVRYEIAVTNIGNVTLREIEVFDAQVLQSGKVATIHRLAPGETLRLSQLPSDTTLPARGTLHVPLQVRPDQAELDAGLLLNTASAVAVYDDTEIPQDAASSTPSTQTKLFVSDVALTLDKVYLEARSSLSESAEVGDQLAYEFTVTNTGVVTLDLENLRDGLTDFVFVDALPAGQTLAPGARVVFWGMYPLVAADLERGFVRNTATIDGVYEPGITKPDPNDPSGPEIPVRIVETARDLEYADLPITPKLSLEKRADDTALTVPPEVGQLITYTFTVKNTGLVTVTDIVLSDPMVGLVLAETGPFTLAPEATKVITGQYALTQDDLDRGYVDNRASVTGRWTPEDKDPTDAVVPTPVVVTEASVTKDGLETPTRVELIMKGEFTAQKSVDRESVVLGDTFGYTLTFESQSTGRVSMAHLVDQLPAGVIYAPGSARIEVSGRPIEALEPRQEGRVLTWQIANIPRKGTIVVRFDARLSGAAALGSLVNRTWSETSEGERTSPIAMAEVDYLPEHLFQCSDVTGKVFEDLNFNGLQDSRDTRAITQQNFEGGKYGKADALPPEPQDERGLAGVRLVTPTGTVITTDAQGRYSIPCAEMPRDIGSNFTLKLDPHSLPTGYGLTTENPRTLRLTAGTSAGITFGAALLRNLHLDLSHSAFEGQAVSAALAEALRLFVQEAEDSPYKVTLAYHMAQGEEPSAVQGRLRAAQERFETLWQGRTQAMIFELSSHQAR